MDEIGGEIDEGGARTAKEGGAVGGGEGEGNLGQGWGTEGEFCVWGQKRYGVKGLKGSFWGEASFCGAGEKEEGEGVGGGIAYL